MIVYVVNKVVLKKLIYFKKVKTGQNESHMDCQD